MKQMYRTKRIAAGILLCPFVLFLLFIVSLYIPPVQDFLRERAISYVSETSGGMEINIRRIDLRFPFNLLARDVKVVQSSDTITLDRINVRIRILSLLHGKIEIQGVTLQGGTIHAFNPVAGMYLEGEVGQFYVRDNEIDLVNETAFFGKAELNNARLRLVLSNEFFDPLPKDTSVVALDWHLLLRSFKLKNVSFDIQIPKDSFQLDTSVKTVTISDAEADLSKQRYCLQKCRAEIASVNYNVGQKKKPDGFDPLHVTLQNMKIEIDSLMNRKEEVQAIIRDFSMDEHSGFHVVSMAGKLYADSSKIDVSSFTLSTPHSQIELEAQIPLNTNKANVPLATCLKAYIGKKDVMHFAADLPLSFKESYPDRPLTIQVNATGDLNAIHISCFSAELPEKISLTGSGELRNVVNDSIRSGNMDLRVNAGNLAFLTGLVSDNPFTVPKNIVVGMKATVNASQYGIALRMKGDGLVNLTAEYNTDTEEYHADLQTEDLLIGHFLPVDSLCTLTASLTAKGRKIDFMSPNAWALLHASITDLRYGQFRFSRIDLYGDLKNTVLTARLTSDNPLLRMTSDATYHLADPYDNVRVNVDMKQMELYKMGIVSHPLKSPVVFTLEAEALRDSVKVSMVAGDVNFRFRARNTIEQLIGKSAEMVNVLRNQIKDKKLDHKEIRRFLPSAGLVVRAGTNNPFNQFLESNNISYKRLTVGFVATPSLGINGRLSIEALKIDTLRLDTLFLVIRQDTACLSIRGGITNNKYNPHLVFKSSITGEIRSNDAELMLDYENEKGEKGVLLGVNVRPSMRNGVRLTFIPEEPVVAFRKFHFNEHNRVSIRNDFHVIADVEMLDKDNAGIRVHSLRDTTSQQNLDIEIRKIHLEEFSNLPYFPQLTGEFSAEGNYKQKPDFKQISIEATLKNLTYEKQLIGDMSLGLVWLPDDMGKQYVQSFLSYQGSEVLTAEGTFYGSEEESHIDAKVELEHFPLHIINVFIPDGLATFSGDMDGECLITGASSQPSINGKLILDEVFIDTHQYSARFNLDNRAVQITNNRMMFDNFSIYTTRNNPFVVKGFIDFQDINHPWADLTLRANNYTLLDARRKRGNLLYGKVFVDVNSTIKGPLESLVMRGNMNVRGNTDVTYVLADSPLTIQDRLGDLVTFTSFADTVSAEKEKIQTVLVKGLDVLMAVHIDQAARLKADLSADRNSRIEFEGGGDLSFQYTPRGDMTLTGRYTLHSGLVKYAFSVIPLKEFTIKNGSYMEWTGNITDPKLALKATERIRTSVMREDGSSRMVSFDVSIGIMNRLENLDLSFDLEAPEDISIQNQLAMMSSEERNKQAVAMLVTGMYLPTGNGIKNTLDMGDALNNVLQNQISSIAGSAFKKVNISFGMDNYDNDNGGKQRDYNFRYAQRFFNDRFQVVIGGHISTNDSNMSQNESFIDNISLEYRLDVSGTRYVRIYHNKNFDNLLEGEITETGTGIVLRKRVNKLKDLFIFRGNNP